MSGISQQSIDDFLLACAEDSRQYASGCVRSVCGFEASDPLADIALPRHGECAQQFEASCLARARLFLERLSADEALIRQFFALPQDDAILGLSRLDRSSSVFSIDFASGARVVYKAGSSDADAFWRELCRMADLPCMEVLPCGDHLYCSYISQQALPNPDPASILDPANPAASDPNVELYFQRVGSILAFLHLCGAGDVHSENVRAVGNAPMMIDTDLIFHTGIPVWSILVSGVLPYVYEDHSRAPYEASLCNGAFCPFYAAQQPSDELSGEADKPVSTLDLARVPASEHIPAIKAGYLRVCQEVIPAKRQRILQLLEGLRYRALPLSFKKQLELNRAAIAGKQIRGRGNGDFLSAMVRVLNVPDVRKLYTAVGSNTVSCDGEALGYFRSINLEDFAFRLDKMCSPEDIALQFEHMDWSFRYAEGGFELAGQPKVPENYTGVLG